MKTHGGARKGAGRKAGSTKVVMHFRLDRETVAHLHAAAVDESMTEIVERAIAQFLSRAPYRQLVQSACEPRSESAHADRGHPPDRS